MLTAINTGPAAGAASIQNLTFGYDGLGNLTSRGSSGGSEAYGYDVLNRLKTRDGTTIASYDPNGNITSKTEVGGQTVNHTAYHATKPHAVTSVTFNAQTITLDYDANGNLDTRTGNGETWSFRYAGFDKPRWMAKNEVGSEFLYNANRSRTVQLEFDQMSGGAPSRYVRKRIYGLGSTLEANYEADTPSASPTWRLKKVRIYVPGPDGLIGAREFDVTQPSGGTEKVLVYHYDHLGSIESITEFGSTAVAFAADDEDKPGRFSEDAWGQRRDPLTWNGSPTATDDGGADSLTPRGFTGHEMLDGLGFVHMNGRIYDPLLGRMLSADVFVQNPGSLQDYNRYSYVRNNPLSFTDPSGWLSLPLLPLWIQPETAKTAPPAAANFTVGVVAGYVAESNFGATINTTGNLPATAGKTLGNALGVVQGAAEMAGGGTIATGGGLVSATGIGAPPGALAVAGGTALAGHGAVVAANSTKKLADSIQQLRSEVRATQAQPKTGSDGGAINPQEPATAPKGSANENTKAAAAHGTKLHSDQPGNLPDQLRNAFPETQFEFKPPGQLGQDVKAVEGMHPSAYPGSSWPKGSNFGDFKPATPGGDKTFKSDQKLSGQNRP